MLKSTELKKLKVLFGKDTDKLIEAIRHEDEQDFEVPEVKTYSDDDLAARDENVKKLADKEGYDRGKLVGKELLAKDIAKKYSLDIDAKDTAKLLTALDTIATGGDAATKERIDLLIKNNEKLEADLLAEKANNETVLFDTELLSSFPAGRKGDMSDKDYLLLLKNNLEFGKDDEGKRFVKKDGVILRDDKTKDYIAPKDAVATFFVEKKFVEDKQPGGRGGNDNPGGSGGGIKTLSQAQEQFLKDNPGGNILSPEGEAYIETVAKATTDFNYDA
jgi:hypothetical protein